jgi:hypothetical protein
VSWKIDRIDSAEVRLLLLKESDKLEVYNNSYSYRSPTVCLIHHVEAQEVSDVYDR